MFLTVKNGYQQQFKNQTLMDRKCKICQKKIVGRSDKIFCDIRCKNQYHQHLRFITKKAAIEINSYLRRNYVILWEVWEIINIR